MKRKRKKEARQSSWGRGRGAERNSFCRRHRHIVPPVSAPAAALARVDATSEHSYPHVLLAFPFTFTFILILELTLTHAA